MPGNYTLNWYIITSSMGICFFVAFSCIVLQYKSTQHFWDKLKCTQAFIDITAIREMRESTAKQSLLLYFVYICSGLCALNCFFCHISSFSEQFCQYGMAICVVIYASAKTFVYGYLLERAVVQNYGNPILPLFLLKIIFPIYLFIYWLIYAISCPAYFRGSSLSNVNDAEMLTACKFDKFWPELFLTSSILDIVHWIVLTFLFLAPTLRDIYNGNLNTFNNTESIKLFISQMNIHILCTFICSMSSTIFMIIMSDARFIKPEYIWFGGNIDMMINCVASFTTIPANRDYIMENIFCLFCCKYCCCGHVDRSDGCGNIMQCKWCCGLLITYLITNMHQSSELMDDSVKANANDNQLSVEYKQTASNIEMRTMKQEQDQHNTNNGKNHNNHHTNHNHHRINNHNYEQPLMLNDCSSDSLNPMTHDIDDNNDNDNDNNNHSTNINTANPNNNGQHDSNISNNGNNNHSRNNHNERPQRSSMFNLLMT
mmetsp:Transcript_5225/g.4561  ORF Transcript_5225/g.4561 Transcript_5225/m.4561 type:complete len:485 (+) Transcript_5225:105-1559(+)